MIAEKFDTVQITSEQYNNIIKLKEAYTELDNVINELCPQSRARSIALTELETSSMWATKSIFHTERKE